MQRSIFLIVLIHAYSCVSFAMVDNTTKKRALGVDDRRCRDTDGIERDLYGRTFFFSLHLSSIFLPSLYFIICTRIYYPGFNRFMPRLLRNGKLLLRELLRYRIVLCRYHPLQRHRRKLRHPLQRYRRKLRQRQSLRTMVARIQQRLQAATVQLCTLV